MDNVRPNEQAGSSPMRTRAGRNPADNLTQEDRIRGGQRSAGSQVRGPKGQFAGSVRRLGGDARQGENSAAGPNSSEVPQGQP
jgi:hypothetical protein